jgi:hypothetical protein
MWGARAAAIALWVLVGAGALGGCAAFVVRPLASPTRAPKTTAPASSTGAEGFAELYVATYLSDAGGSETANDVLKTFYPGGDVDLRDVRPHTLYVTQTVALDATQVSKGYWSITVGARVMAASANGYVPLGLRAYQVGVARSAEGGFVATSAPGQVPLPRAASLPKLKGPALASPDATHSDVNAALQRFFAAYLTGQGELSRYVAPDAGLVAVSPAPYSGVALQRVSLEATTIKTAAGANPINTKGFVARVVVAAIDTAERTQVFSYSVELAQRENRWEVRKLLPAAPLAHTGAPAAAPTTTTTAFFSSDATPTTATTAPAAGSTSDDATTTPTTTP